MNGVSQAKYQSPQSIGGGVIVSSGALIQISVLTECDVRSADITTAIVTIAAIAYYVMVGHRILFSRDACLGIHSAATRAQSLPVERTIAPQKVEH